ncbi:MAG: phosphate propanoyltransferase [Hespellia sp.]|nr:phosphate propanoyltransferase [Hespellia sp.]
MVNTAKVVDEEFVRMITEKVIEQLKMEKPEMENIFKIPVGVSNRHVHVTKEDLETLFGEGYELTRKSELKQPGQFAANETVIIRGPKGEFDKVRILGPVRPQSQVEISKTDTFRLGIKAPIKTSGDLADTPGIELIGPKGNVTLPAGTIVALRHIHMTPEQAKVVGLKDMDVVEVETTGERRGVLGDVLVRVTNTSALEIHVDVDEANACALNNDDFVLLRY